MESNLFNLLIYSITITNELTKLLAKHELVIKTAAEMQKTILMDSETLLRKVLSGIVQSDTEEN